MPEPRHMALMQKFSLTLKSEGASEQLDSQLPNLPPVPLPGEGSLQSTSNVGIWGRPFLDGRRGYLSGPPSLTPLNSGLSQYRPPGGSAVETKAAQSVGGARGDRRNPSQASLPAVRKQTVQRIPQDVNSMSRGFGIQRSSQHFQALPRSFVTGQPLAQTLFQGNLGESTRETVTKADLPRAVSSSLGTYLGRSTGARASHEGSTRKPATDTAEVAVAGTPPVGSNPPKRRARVADSQSPPKVPADSRVSSVQKTEEGTPLQPEDEGKLMRQRRNTERLRKKQERKRAREQQSSSVGDEQGKTPGEQEKKPSAELDKVEHGDQKELELLTEAERRQRRKLRNRESAMRSLQKKRDYEDSLVRQVRTLRGEIGQQLERIERLVEFNKHLRKDSREEWPLDLVQKAMELVEQAKAELGKEAPEPAHTISRKS
ncbi:hypothetical protein NDN08_008337 [Rhodosorus marinus]|uniref:BZIP domain-containing protein n=1 Tax=Rhodosorus marinus TaxID=101924 RepID=A0AAV8V4Q1_9RHOD|nr:hypothetical protein NDN08_008337 [Rhodosorus marinus]